MTSAEQAEQRMAASVLAFYCDWWKPGQFADLASALNQPPTVVCQALLARRMSVATAALLARAMGAQLVPTEDGRAMEVVG